MIRNFDYTGQTRYELGTAYPDHKFYITDQPGQPSIELECGNYTGEDG